MEILFYIAGGASADGVGPKLEPLAVPPSYLGSSVTVRSANPDVA